MRIGELVIAKRKTGVCDVGEVGVCYEVYARTWAGSGQPGYSFIFASGRYDGFSPDEIALMLLETGIVAPRVAGYRFHNVTQLDRDFQAGLFASAFDGWLMPGVYDDGAGGLHLVPAVLLAANGYVDTPENRATLMDVTRNLLRDRYPNTTISEV